ncbi:MAG: YggT family protein [Acidimicrobiia bacterium]|jgi:YggT family protein
MGLRGLACFLLQIYSFAVLLWVILSWIRIGADHPLGRVVVFLDRIIYPVVLPLRRVLPPIRLGGAMLDLSPIVLLLGIALLQRLVC